MDSINLDIQLANQLNVSSQIKTLLNKKNIHTNNKITHENPAANSNAHIMKSQNTKLLPIYIHGNINHIKLLDALKEKYKNTFQVKFVSNKLKIMFTNLNDFNDFKTTCKNENMECLHDQHGKNNNGIFRRTYTASKSKDMQ